MAGRLLLTRMLHSKCVEFSESTVESIMHARPFALRRGNRLRSRISKPSLATIWSMPTAGRPWCFRQEAWDWTVPGILAGESTGLTAPGREFRFHAHGYLLWSTP